MPKGIDYVDATIYQGFAWLYKRYFDGQITREQAKEEKQQLLYEYNKQKDKKQHEEKMYKWHADLIKKCEVAAITYAKEPTIENADKFYATFYNLPENWREAAKTKGAVSHINSTKNAL